MYNFYFYRHDLALSIFTIEGCSKENAFFQGYAKQIKSIKRQIKSYKDKDKAKTNGRKKRIGKQTKNFY